MRTGIFRLFRRVSLIAVTFAMLIGVGASTPAIATTTEAKAVVQRFHDSLLGVMKDAFQLGYRGRYAALTSEVTRAFHLPVIARVATGRHWKKLSRPQKENLVKAVGRMITATSAHRFDEYGGERFRFVEAVDLRPRAVMVKTEIIKTDGGSFKLDYLVRWFKSGWRVVDVYLNGAYSELATKRSEYSHVLRRRGVKGLIAEIDRKVSTYEADDAKR